MRCKNCGWENSPSSPKCEKCNAPLMGSMISNIEEVAPVQPSEPANLKSTVSDSNFFGGVAAEPILPINPVEPAETKSDAALEGMSDCKVCGYPIGAGMKSCPSCGAQLGEVEPQPKPQPQSATNGIAVVCKSCGKELSSDMKFCGECGAPIHFGTINPWVRPDVGSFCSLTPIAWDGENAIPETKSYSGEKIVLTRGNTDPNNQSITSQEQAELSYEDGEWYIIDKSAQKTTYVHAGSKMKLESGDIVILGNRRFEFKK